MSRETWDGYQDEIATWKSQILPPGHDTPATEFRRGFEEVEELHEAIKGDNGTPEAQREIAMESADVIIRMLGVISATGHNAADLIAEKLDVIKEKYPPEPIRGDLAQGVPFDLAMARQKRLWQVRQAGITPAVMPKKRRN